MKLIKSICALGVLSTALLAQHALAGAGCEGDVTRLYVESNGDTYISLSSGNCSCNYSTGGYFQFRVPAAQANSKQSYGTALAGLVGNKRVMIWYDWTSGSSNVSQCIAHSVTIIK